MHGRVSTVEEAAYIVYVAVLAIAAQRNWVCRIFKTEEVQTAHAALVTGGDADGDTIFGLLVNHNVVGTAQRQRLAEVAVEVFVVVKQNGGIRWVNIEQLAGLVNFCHVMQKPGAEEPVPFSCQRFGCRCPPAHCQ
jgi:hypothetical protein